MGSLVTSCMLQNIFFASQRAKLYAVLPLTFRFLAHKLGIPVWKVGVTVGQKLDGIRIANSKRVQQKIKDKFNHKKNEAMSRKGPEEYGSGIFLPETPL